MKKYLILLFGCLIGDLISAQHCAPIDKTILTEISVVRDNSSLHIQFEFIKNGGQIKDAYQVYLLAYLEKNKKEVFKELQKASHGKHLANIYNKNTTVILKRDIIKQSLRLDKNAGGTIYGYLQALRTDEIARQIIAHGDLKNEANYWGEFKIAVFIPFLDNKEHSVDLLELPQDTHECNYDGRSSLIMQELSYSFKIYTEKDNKSNKAYFIIPVKEQLCFKE